MVWGILKDFQKYFGCFTSGHFDPFSKLFQPSKLGVSMIFELFILFFVYRFGKRSYESTNNYVVMFVYFFY